MTDDDTNSRRLPALALDRLNRGRKIAAGLMAQMNADDNELEDFDILNATLGAGVLFLEANALAQVEAAAQAHIANLLAFARDPDHPAAARDLAAIEARKRLKIQGDQ